MTMTNTNPTSLNIVLFGSSGVGKTCLLTQLIERNFYDGKVKCTLNLESREKNYNYDGKTIKLSLWDTAGFYTFDMLPSSMYRNMQGAVLVYDITDRQSFKDMQTWMQSIENYFDGMEKYPAIIVLGNKIDMKSSREVSREDGSQFAKRHRALFLETSAKTNTCVDTAFDDLISKIMETPGLVRSENSDSIVRLSLNLSDTAWYQNCIPC